MEYEYLIGFRYNSEREGFIFGEEGYTKVSLSDNVVKRFMSRNKIDKIEITTKEVVICSIYGDYLYITALGFMSAIKSYYKYNKRKSTIESI